MIECPEYTLTLPPPCPTNWDHLTRETYSSDGGSGHYVLSSFSAVTRYSFFMGPVNPLTPKG